MTALKAASPENIDTSGHPQRVIRIQQLAYAGFFYGENMGTITIIEYKGVGGITEGQAQVLQLENLKRTVDSSTSTAPETITLDDDTSVIRVVADSAHRISIDNNVDDAGNYDDVSTTPQDYGINQGKTLYYRADA